MRERTRDRQQDHQHEKPSDQRLGAPSGHHEQPDSRSDQANALNQPGPPGKTSVTRMRCLTISLPNVTGLRWKLDDTTRTPVKKSTSSVGVVCSVYDCEQPDERRRA